MPQSITAFLESGDFEDAVRKAVSIGGDSDTIACLAGGIAEAFYGKVPDFIWKESFNRLDRYMQDIVTGFYKKYM